MSKASKFTMVEPDIQAQVAHEVNDRMEKAVEELKEKYEKGRSRPDSSVSQPTGYAYQHQQQQQQQKGESRREEEEEEQEALDALDQLRLDRQEDEDDEEEDDEYDDLLDEIEDDPVLRKLREDRMAQIKKEHEDHLLNLAKGHGEYSEVSQDDFLPSVTGSDRVVAHFYHREFERSHIMDMHLSILASLHMETKFIKIDAEKAPFFIDKLKIRVLPSVLVFNDGISKARITGFEGLSDGMMPGREDEWPTARLQEKLLELEAITHLKPLPGTSTSVGGGAGGWGSSSARRFGGDEDDYLDEDDL